MIQAVYTVLATVAFAAFVMNILYTLKDTRQFMLLSSHTDLEVKLVGSRTCSNELLVLGPICSLLPVFSQENYKTEITEQQQWSRYRTMYLES
jgi:hypothetical protein